MPNGIRGTEMSNEGHPGDETVASDGGTSRRTVLRSLAGGSVAGGVAIATGLDESRDSENGHVPITYGVTRHQSDPYTLTERRRWVPAAWYDRMETAIAAHGRLLESNLGDLVGAFVEPGGYDDPRATLSVDVTADSLHDRIADLLDGDGIDLDVSTVDEVPPERDESEEPAEPVRVFDLDDFEVPGGVQCAADGGFGSLAPAVYDPEREEAMLASSNHVLGGTDRRGEPVELVDTDDRRRTIGHVAEGHADVDVGLAAPTDGITPTSEIVGTSPGTVRGSFTLMGLADLAARGRPVEKVGATTGHAEGQVRGINGVTTYYGEVPKIGQLKWGEQSDMGDGDSGSVAYAPDPEAPEDGVLVAGFNNARTWWPGADYVWGTAAHHLRDTYGYHF